MPEHPKPSCFISAPFGYSTELLERALAERGIGTSRFSEMSPAVDVLGTLEQQIRAADLFVAVFPRGKNTETVLFEVGLARGMGRPTLLLLEQDVLLPYELVALRTASVQLQDSDSLQLVAGGILQEVEARDRKADAKRPLKRLVAADVTALRVSIAALRSPESAPGGIQHLQVEKALAAALEAAGARVSISGRGHDHGADLAVWIDELQPVLGNPLLIELKYGDLSEVAVATAETQLRRYLAVAKAFGGIVAYLDTQGKRFGKTMGVWPLIFLLSLDEIANLIERGDLAPELIRRRNAAAHGKI
jgi:hypothetical protein